MQIIRAGNIVIHRFRDGDDLESFLVEPDAVTEGIVAADRDESIDPKKIKVLEDFRGQVVALILVLILQMRRDIFELDPGGIGAGGMQERTAGAPGPVDHFLGQDLEVVAVVGVLLTYDIHQPTPAALQANHLVAFTDGTHGYGTNSRIQARHIPATGQDADDSGFLL
jgi:hypothetical protein